MHIFQLADAHQIDQIPYDLDGMALPGDFLLDLAAIGAAM
jgi:hypothetical protein